MAATITPAQAWDDVGHEIVARIAYDHLNPSARVAVDQLSAQMQGPHGAYDATTIACWMDDIRHDSALPDYRRFLSWHYVDIPTDPRDPAPPFEPGTDNDVHGNALAGIKRALVVLRGGSDPYVTSLPMALAIVEHLAGDLHQPLHCATKYFFAHGRRLDDRGGNDEFVLNGPAGDAKFNLHAFWDAAYRATFDPVGGNVALDPATRANAAALAMTLPVVSIPTPSVNADVDSWARESNGVARDFVYRDLMIASSPKFCRLSAPYVAKARAISQGRLELAGLRLALLLNESLGPDRPATPPASYPPGPPSVSPAE